MNLKNFAKIKTNAKFFRIFRSALVSGAIALLLVGCDEKPVQGMPGMPWMPQATQETNSGKESGRETTSTPAHQQTARNQTPREAQPQQIQAAPASPRAGAKALKLVRQEIRDPQVGNEVAIRMLAPAGWKVSGGVEWRHWSRNLAVTNYRVIDPATGDRLTMYPHDAFCAVRGAPTGSNYQGSECRSPIMDPAAYVQQIVLPRYRRDVRGAKIVENESLPEIASERLKAIQEPGLMKQVRAGRVRIEYTEAGQTVEEDIFVVLDQAYSPQIGSSFWGPSSLYSFKAAKGNLDARKGLFQAIASSNTLTVEWFGKFMQVHRMWQDNQYAAIHHAGLISQYFAKTSDEISAIYRNAYEDRQRSQDRTAAQYSRHIRGVESYHDPVSHREVQLPSGYRDVWVNTRGEYYLSENSGFNPNEGDTVTWQRMNVAR